MGRGLRLGHLLMPTLITASIMEVSVLITLSPQAEKLQEKLENQPIAEEEQIPGSKSQCLAYLEVGEVHRL